MPIRYRKSVKIAPGTRLNISNRGVSASVGAGGVRASTGKSKGCLYNIFIAPFVLIFQLYALLFKGLVWLWKKATATPQSRRVSLITIGVLFVISLCSSAVSAFTGKGTPQPTQDTSKIKSLALTSAWIQQTQTAMALPTFTSTLTSTPTETLTASPAPTIADTSTPLPTATIFISILPTQPPPVQSAVCSCSGDTLNCSDFSSHSSAQACFNYCNSQGAGDIHRLDGNNDGSACDSLK